MNYAEFRSLVRERGRFETEQDAAESIRAVLEVLGQKISQGQAEDLIPWIPAEIGPYLKQTPEAEPLTLTDFLLRLSDKEHITIRRAEEHSRAVLSVLGEVIPDKELNDTVEQLPKAMRDYFAWIEKVA